MHIVEAKDKKIRDILNSEGQLIVPRFQRPYSWNDEKINEFFNDILENIDTDYFIGALVLYKINNIDKGIIDGQQRLTTIIIILATIRDELVNLGEKDFAQGVHINYIEKRDVKNKEYYKISTETSYPYFQLSVLPLVKEEITSTLTTDEEVIKKATLSVKNFLEERVKDKNKNIQIDELNKIKDRILNLATVYIELDNEDDAYQIFETLNTRGEDLSLADRMKNHLFRYITTINSERDSANIIWKQIIKIINDISPSMDDFIYHRWNSYNSLTTKAKIFKEFRLKIKDKKSARIEINSMLSDVKIYHFINNPIVYINDKFNNKRIKEYLQIINIFGIKLGHPALIAILKKYDNNEISLKNILAFLEKMVRFHFIFNTLLSSRSSGITNAYVYFAQSISRDTGDKNKIIREFYLFNNKFEDKKETIKQSFKSIIFTNKVTKQKKIVQYILTQLDRYYSKNLKKDLSNMTIEHLLPQSLLKDGFTDEQIGQIGNLILVDETLQDKLKNKPLKEKIVILNENNIFLPHLDISCISDKPNENISLISERTENIFNNDFEKIWKI